MGRLLAVPLSLFSLAVAGVVVALATQVSARQLWEAVFQAETLFALRFSLVVSCAAMLVAVCLGISSAYFLARRSFPGKGLLDALLDVPLVMPPLVAGVGLLFLLGREMLGQPMADMGLHLIFTPLGAVTAQAFIATPIVIRNAKAAFESVDHGYEETAMSLGLNPWRVFFWVNLPLAGRSILSGVILAWARTMGEFGATLMVAGATRLRTETLPIAVYLNISSGELGIAVSCALVLLSVAFCLLLALRFIQNPKANGEKELAWPRSI